MTSHIPRVFSGVQPTGNLHLGNYLGAIRHFVGLQKTHQTLYCIVDMHAITVWQKPEDLRKATYDVTAAFLAAGLDAQQSIIFNQSKVPAHAQVGWVFNCVSRMGWLNRMTQFKEKAGKNKENASVGLYTYPNLMAADILAYKATHVPVGEDQKQHLELARDIAQKFNHDYECEDFFPQPEPLIMPEGARIMSLRDGRSKMSKSDPSDYSRINLTDTADEIRAKIRKAKTDPDALPDSVDGFENRPEAENLYNIYAILSGETKQSLVEQFSGKQFSQLKETLVDVTVTALEPITLKMRQLQSDIPYLDTVLNDGADRANAISQPIVKDIYQKIGFI